MIRKDSRLPLIQAIPNLLTAFYCIELHAYKSREHGTSQSDIADSVLVTVALGAGAAVTHGMHVLKNLSRISAIGLGI